MHRFLLAAALLLLSLASRSQDQPINQKKKDSLINAIEATARALRASQDSFVKQHDSFMREQDSLSRVTQYPFDAEQNNRNLQRLMHEIKEREDRKTRQAYVRIGMGILFLIILIIGVVRRKKARKS